MKNSGTIQTAAIKYLEKKKHLNYSPKGTLYSHEENIVQVGLPVVTCISSSVISVSSYTSSLVESEVSKSSK